MAEIVRVVTSGVVVVVGEVSRGVAEAVVSGSPGRRAVWVQSHRNKPTTPCIT